MQKGMPIVSVRKNGRMKIFGCGQLDAYRGCFPRDPVQVSVQGTCVKDYEITISFLPMTTALFFFRNGCGGYLLSIRVGKNKKDFGHR